jgi:glycosyltransferase involved in cell wall biosynthesis
VNYLQNKNQTTKLTAFLGIYNGEKYLNGLLEQIVSQEFSNYDLLIVDNASSDSSYELIKSWTSKIPARRVSIRRNRVNLGGQGNWNLNLMHVRTPWITMLHQDDFYKPNHLGELNRLINNANKSIIGVCTTMGSMSFDGKKLNSMPRSSWFNKNLEAPNQFIQNIKSQSVPYPSTAFLVSAVAKTKIPIHSPTFSDTEQTLRLLGYGKFNYSKVETMLYRENPQSESHVLNLNERYIGTSIALHRVFNSKEFSLLLDKVSFEERGSFALKLIKSLELRFPQGPLLDQITLTALEAIVNCWGYTEKSINKLLYSKYEQFASPLTLEIISSLGGLRNRKHKLQKPENKLANKSVAQLWKGYFNIDLHFLSKFNKIFLLIVYRLIFIVRPNHRWKVNK